LVLEYGPLEGIMKFGPSVLPCMLMFAFVNKSISMAVIETIATGEAHYIATGRPNANTHYSWRECYFLFVKTHFYPGLQVLVMVLFYTLLAQQFESSSLPMLMICFTATMWINAPVLFCPQPTMETLTRDMGELWNFVIATPDWSIRTAKVDKNKTTEQGLRSEFRDMRATLFEFWLKTELEHKKAGIGRRILIIVYEVVKFMILLSVIYSSMIDNFWDFIVLVCLNWALWDTWRVLSRPTFWFLLVIILWMLSPFLWFDMPWVNFFTFLILTIQFFSVLKQFILFICWLYFDPRLDWPSEKESTDAERTEKQKLAANAQSYDMVVEYLFVNLGTHLTHLFAGGILVMMWFAVQLVCVSLDMLWGIHSWYMLNVNLRSTGCCARRRGFEPSNGVKSEPSAKYLQLSGRTDDD